MLDWLAAYPSRATDSPFAWYDMAVGLRAYRLGYALDVVARDGRYDDATVARLLEGAELHVEVLADDKLFRSHNNHGVYQAAGQLALARRFPELRGMDAARRQGAERLRAMLAQQFAEDGVHLEHSPGYHLLLLDALERMRAAGLLPEGELNDLVANARSALPWFVAPNGRLVPIGDTDMPMGSREPFDRGDDAARFVASRGAAGTPPSSVVREFPASGYAVLRDRWPLGAADFADCGYICQIAGFHSATHRHADDLSFTWSERGVEVLVDAGRFGYLYEHPGRAYVVSTRAHNTVQIDDRDRPSRAEDAYGSALLAAGELDGVRFSETLAPAGTVTHRRLLLWMPERWLVVVDALSDAAGDPHTYRQRFLVAPEHEVHRTTGGYEIVTPKNMPRLHVVSLTTASATEVITGQEEPQLLGWVSRRYLQLAPAPTFAFEVSGSAEAVIATLFAWGEPPLPARGPAGVMMDAPASGPIRGKLAWTQAGGSHEVRLAGAGALAPIYTTDSG
jgi:hypothetical protein